MADLGFKQISVEPVVGSDDTDYAIREEDIPAICEEYERLAAELYERHKKGGEGDFNFFHFNICLLYTSRKRVCNTFRPIRLWQNNSFKDFGRIS